MLVLYRITEIPSTNPSPWSQENKPYMNEVCLRSFVEAFRDVNPTIHFLADHCDTGLHKMIKSVVPFPHEIEHSSMGINGTMLRSYDIAKDVDDFVLFQECDYLYRPHIGKAFLGALQSLDLVSPYDHRNFYLDTEMHSPNVELRLVGEAHFRTTERTTMTWGTHSSLIKEYFSIFAKYGYLDDKVWFDLWLAGKRLWCPIPSFATHLVKDYMAPSIQWSNLWQKYQSQ